LYFFYTLFPDPWDREEVTGGRDNHAGTNVTKLPGLTSYMNSQFIAGCRDREWTETHAGTYGHRNRVASYNMTDFDYDDRQQKTTTSSVSYVIVVDDDVPVP